MQRDASELCFIINIDLLEMKKEKTINQETKVEIGDFGYEQNVRIDFI